MGDCEYGSVLSSALASKYQYVKGIDPLCYCSKVDLPPRVSSLQDAQNSHDLFLGMLDG
jgi:hypothetical protein